MINILISTIDAGIDKVENVFLPPCPDVRYIVSHQVTAERFRALPPALERTDVAVGQIEGRGLCRNRNNSLALADGDIALLADDDVTYRPGYIDALREAFTTDEEMDVACFRIATPEGDAEFKHYAEQGYRLNAESRHYISTIEIAFRLGPVRERCIRFDERFGLGSPLNSFGEEAVFIHDCIKAGLSVKYVPADVVEHPAASSIKSTGRFAELNVVFKGAYDARRYGWPAFPAAFYDTLRLWPQISREGKPPLRYLAERLRGAAYIYRSPRGPG